MNGFESENFRLLKIELKNAKRELSNLKALNAELLAALRLLVYSWPAHLVFEPNHATAMQVAKALLAKAPK